VAKVAGGNRAIAEIWLDFVRKLAERAAGGGEQTLLRQPLASASNEGVRVLKVSACRHQAL
jgi:hypothetical protein